MPLVALTAGIQINLRHHSNGYGCVNVVHLDEHYEDPRKRSEFILELKCMYAQVHQEHDHHPRSPQFIVADSRQGKYTQGSHRL